jgi:DNA replication factor GINS
MELEELRGILLSERETGRLTVIPQDLYGRTRETIAAMYAEVCATDDPLSDEARRLIEATQSMRETVQEILATRSRKILTLALVQVEGGYVDRDETRRMQVEERGMFDLITHALDECRQSLLKGEGGTEELPVEKEPEKGKKSRWQALESEEEPERGRAGGVQADPAVPAPRTHKQKLADYDLVRVLADVDQFLGVDGRIYELKKEDILTLPKRNADVLSARNIVLNMNLIK